MMRGYYGPMMGGGGHFLGGFIAFLLGVAVIVGIVLLVVWLVRKSSHQQYSQAPVAGAPQPPVMPATRQDEPLAIARRRYASGEINRDQYEEIIRTLGG